MNCPICNRTVNKSDPEFPFCSERCRNEDLGNWVYGRYRVPAPMSEEEEIPDQSAVSERGEENGE
jgi:endogenous inhibitor of DNA gyrase (YacG/DUF329 family)